VWAGCRPGVAGLLAGYVDGVWARSAKDVGRVLLCCQKALDCLPRAQSAQRAHARERTQPFASVFLGGLGCMGLDKQKAKSTNIVTAQATDMN